MTDLEITKRSTYAERRRGLHEQIVFALRNHRVNEDGCWIWLGPKYRGTYGKFMAKRRHILAHRASYEVSVGPIPQGFVIDHLCRIPLCINPAHLEAVSNKENLLRGIGCAAINSRKTHCVRGHELIGDNLYIYYGKRICKQCRRETLKAWRLANG